MGKRTKLRRQKISMVIKLTFVGAASFALTMFIFLSSFELLFNKDIRYVQAIGAVGTLQSRRIITPLASKIVSDNEALGSYGKPHELRLPSNGFRMAVIPYIKSSNDFLFRANNAHFILTSPSKQGGMGNLVIYLTRDWRTINEPNAINSDDNVFLDTDKSWRYMYRIVDKKVISVDDSYVPTESARPHLVLLIEDQKNKRSYVYEADLVNLQNIER